jgi:outer membrane protein assembly factor BamE (lipoprotein component of BamABCDE complex)
VTGEVSQESGVPISVAPSAPATVEVGESLDQVQAIMGAPARVANLGSKVIYYYSDKKVTFKDGKVSDVQ